MASGEGDLARCRLLINGIRDQLVLAEALAGEFDSERQRSRAGR